MLCIMHNSLYMDDDPGKGFCFLLEKSALKRERRLPECRIGISKIHLQTVSLAL